MNKQKVIDGWISKHGAASFDLREKDIILWDSGLFSISKEVKTKNKTRVVVDKKPTITKINGKDIKSYRVNFIPVKKNGKPVKEKVEDYKAVFWMEELDEVINYLISMRKMLRSIGIKTDTSVKWMKKISKRKK